MRGFITAFFSLTLITLFRETSKTTVSITPRNQIQNRKRQSIAAVQRVGNRPTELCRDQWLSLEEHRDADTWGLRLMELGDHGWNPEATIADGGRGLRAGQQWASPGLPCRGDVFHAIREVGQVATYLENRAYGTITVCEQQERRMRQAQRQGEGHKHSKRRAQARQEELHAVRLAADVSLLVSWLRDDVLSVSGPAVATRRDLFDFLVAELERLAPLCSHRLTPVIRALRNQRDDLLAFAEELDRSLTALAEEHRVSVAVVREVLALLTPRTTPQWQAEAALRRQLGERFHALRTAVAALADHTVRASSVVENIHRRLRNDFFLRRHLSGEYLDLVRCDLNHHRFPRSDRPDRVGRSPHELLTGQPQWHGLDQLTNSPSHAASRSVVQTHPTTALPLRAGYPKTARFEPCLILHSKYRVSVTPAKGGIQGIRGKFGVTNCIEIRYKTRYFPDLTHFTSSV